MPILREVVLAVPALIVCLLISHAVFGPEREAPVRPSAAARGTWIGTGSLTEARWLAKDSFVSGSSVVADPPGEQRPPRRITPHARIQAVFAQFVPGESGRAI